MRTDAPRTPTLAETALRRARGAGSTAAYPAITMLAARAAASPAQTPGLFPAVGCARSPFALPLSVQLCRIYLTSSTARNVLRISRCFVSDSGSFTSWRISMLSAVIAFTTPSANRSFG